MYRTLGLAFQLNTGSGCFSPFANRIRMQQIRLRGLGWGWRYVGEWQPLWGGSSKSRIEKTNSTATRRGLVLSLNCQFKIETFQLKVFCEHRSIYLLFRCAGTSLGNLGRSCFGEFGRYILVTSHPRRTTYDG